MKKAFSLLLALALVLSFSLVAVPVGVVGGSTDTINVSQPVQVTNSTYYERGQSIIYDGSNYWLFYGRSDSVTATYGTGNPDTSDYQIYYKKASSVAGLAAATATVLNNTDNHNIFNGEISAASDGGTGRIYVYGAVDRDGVVGGQCDLYQFGTSNNGSTWTSWNCTAYGVSGVLPGGAAHHAAVNYGGQLWVAWHESGGWTSKYYSGGWSSKKDIFTGDAMGKFYVEGTHLYFVRANNARLDIYEWNGSTWSTISGSGATESGALDPTIYKVGSNYVCAYAPWVSPSQWIKAKVGTSLSTLLSSPTVTVNITAGGYSTTNKWVDMWPTGFTDNSGDTYLFYTSERNPSGPSSEIAGNIWYLKVDWPVTNDHYTYIQNAVDAASSTTINVVAGMYNEDITITKGLTLTTPSGSPATIDGGIWIKDIHTYTNPITVEYFTIQNGTTISGIKDYGIKVTGDPGAGSDVNIVDMHIVNNTFINCGKTANVNDETWFNAAIFYDANHFGALGSRYDTVFPGTGEISHNTIINNLADPSKRTQLGIGVRSGRNMKINYNNISGNVAEGIHHWSCVNTASDGNYEINHNTIDLTGWIGDRIGNNPRGIWSYARSANISYNTIVSKWYGIVVSYWDDTNWGGATAANYPVTISDNIIHPPAGQSMTAGMRYGGNNGQITDNEIYGATDTSAYGIGLLFEGWGTYGQQVAGERSECKDNTFTNNNIHDNYDGIWTWGSPYDNRSNNVFHSNNVYNNTNSGMTIPGAPTVDARYNWWGANDGPGPVGPGSGDSVSANVLFDPWTTKTATSTGAGTASFIPNTGNITQLAAVAPPSPSPVVLPYGLFSFNVTLPPGQTTVTINITLPGPVPVGYQWWKYYGGAWYSLPIGSDDGDNFITITLTDNVFPGDSDSTLGQIVDPGGPGSFHPVDTVVYGLIISSTAGGSVTTPGEGVFPYAMGSVVKLVASPGAGHGFVNWTGDVDTVEDVDTAETTITILGWYMITANFNTNVVPPGNEAYTLTISSTMGGWVAAPGEGAYAYEAGMVVNLVASPDDGYEFVNWTGDGITNPDSATTAITMNGDYSIKANFQETTTGSTEGPLGCFIATAAYGTPTAKQIDVLREFRDMVLLESAAGSRFVTLYYQLSPPVADFIAGNELLRTLVRELLVDPVVWVVEATGAIWQN